MPWKRRRTHPVEDDMGYSNPGYIATENIPKNGPFCTEMCEFQKRDLSIWISQDDAHCSFRNYFKKLGLLRFASTSWVIYIRTSTYTIVNINTNYVHALIHETISVST